MSAANYDIPAIEQGADFFLDLVYKDDTGTPIDLTGFSARMQVREEYSSAAPVVNISTGTSGITLGGLSGSIAIHIPAADTAALSFNTARYDLELEDSTGVVTRLIQGSVTLSPEVTR